MTETDYDIKAAAFAKELKDLMKKHGVEHLYGSAYSDRCFMISLAAGEHNGETFTMSYRLGNIYNLHAAEVSSSPTPSTNTDKGGCLRKGTI